jgi:colanic acid/amylovoran biosynthesis glycosyltransferase
MAKNHPHIYDHLFAESDLIQPISKRWEKKLVDLGCSRTKIALHRMGIDLGKVRLPASRFAEDGCVKILSVARLIEKKGLEFGVQAISTVVKHYPNVKYLIVGDGPLKKDLLDLIDHLQLSQHVKLMGWMNQDETFKIMQLSDIFLAPSVTDQTGDQEGIPVVIMEAMAHGLPVVSTYHSGIPELVIDTKTGFLVSERDSDELAKKIEFLISNPDILEKFGTEGQRTVETDYNIQMLNDNLVKSFHELTHN